MDENGVIYVADPGNNRIQIFKPDGTYIKEIQIPPFRDHPYMEPYIVVHDGSLYMTHPHKHVVLKYNLSDGKLSGRKGGFKTPTGIALHPDNETLFVSDTFNHKIVPIKLSEIH